MQYKPTMQQVQFFEFAEENNVATNPLITMNLEIRCDESANTLGYALVIRFDSGVYEHDDLEYGVTLVTARKTARLFKSIDTAIEFLRGYGIHDAMVWSTK